MNVLVAGGTGFIGTALCGELVDRGHEVTALARDPSEASLPEGVEAVAGDVTDEAAVADAVDGRDAVVNLVSLSPLFEPTGDADHETVHLGGTRNLVDASEAAGVDRFVQISALDADSAGATAYIRAKGRAERVVRESALDWVIVRPSVVFGEGSEFLSFAKLVTTPYLTGLPGGGATRFQPIWIDDIAPMLADCVEDADRTGDTYELGGPEVLTLADVVELLYESEGRSVRILPIPMVLARSGLTVAEFVPLVPFGRDQARSLEFDNTVGENDVTAFGRSPAELTTLSTYLTGESHRKLLEAD